MKICRKCKQSFADGFKYCPKDATPLMKYDLRSRMQPEYHFLLENRSLISRLESELLDLMEELRHSPLSSIINLFRGEGSNRRRRSLLQAGVVTAVITYSSVILIGLLVGTFKSPVTNRIVDASPPRESTYVRLVAPDPKDDADAVKHSKRGLLGGSLKEPKRSGGGGGRNDLLPANRGHMAMPSLTQQINLPDLSKSRIAQPSLIVPETLYVDPAYYRQHNGPIGVIDGQSIPSLGNGSGTGQGVGSGPGYNSGNGGNLGGGPPKIGGTPPSGDGDGPPWLNSRLKPTILYKEKARYTDEARQYKIQGVVVLNVIFGADGRIQNVRVLRGLPYGLTESAIEAVQRIRFQPATNNGKPVSVRATIEYNFNLY